MKGPTRSPATIADDFIARYGDEAYAKISTFITDAVIAGDLPTVKAAIDAGRILISRGYHKRGSAAVNRAQGSL